MKLILITFFSLLVHQSDLRPNDNSILKPYVGTWISEQKSENNKDFRYEYSLKWFDSGKTIVEMEIHQVFSNSEKTLMWKGFKRYNANKKAYFYEGYSTFGFACLGSVYEEEGNLVTEYDAYSPNGSTMKIKDVFVFKDENHFDSFTYSYSNGEWKEIMKDEWSKVKG